MSRAPRTSRPLFAATTAAELGVPGALAAGLLCFLAVFYVSAFRPAQERLHALRLQAAGLQARAAPAPRDASVASDAALYELFPSPAALPGLLAAIYRAAEAQGLVLARGEYRAVPDAQGRLVEYRLVFPLAGTYPQLRQFVAAALAAVPALALESVRFERQAIGAAVSEARLEFVLQLEKTS